MKDLVNDYTITNSEKVNPLNAYLQGHSSFQPNKFSTYQGVMTLDVHVHQGRQFFSFKNGQKFNVNANMTYKTDNLLYYIMWMWRKLYLADRDEIR